MDNVQNCDSYSKLPSSQTYRLLQYLEVKGGLTNTSTARKSRKNILFFFKLRSKVNGNWAATFLPEIA
jgi:hypothetical protein